jgi:hypothetical protein
MTATEVSGTVTPVAVKGARGGPEVATLRRGAWWAYPLSVVLTLGGFVAYGVWAAFRNSGYYVGPERGRNYISPFYSPCITYSCPTHTFGLDISWWRLSPAILILIFPLGFRLTCYYYRKAYYRGFWLSPPACAVADAHARYTGETRFPLVLQNTHRYFFYVALFFAGLLTYDAVISYQFPGGVGVGLGSLVLTVNAVLIWLYTLSCHACRHLCGGHVDMFSRARLRHRAWKFVSLLNRYHPVFAWISLVFIAFTDFYVWLVAAGHISDLRIV